MRATLLTVGTHRHTSTNVSLDGALVAGSISRMFGGSGKMILTRPFWRRLLKSLACSPLVRKSSASIGRNSGSSASGFRVARRWRSWNLASTWPATAGNGPSPCGSRRTRGRCHPDHPDGDRRMRARLARQRRTVFRLAAAALELAGPRPCSTRRWARRRVDGGGAPGPAARRSRSPSCRIFSDLLLSVAVDTAELLAVIRNVEVSTRQQTSR